ncbi:MAG: hypothetical protein JWP81_4067 [Ferruginibacter sp.]|nr:hypothetical protein [Ferruginibacter sp.]
MRTVALDNFQDPAVVKSLFVLANQNKTYTQPFGPLQYAVQ